jgi:hypothetical protein
MASGALPNVAPGDRDHRVIDLGAVNPGMLGVQRAGNPRKTIATLRRAAGAGPAPNFIDPPWRFMRPRSWRIAWVRC